jgi:uncharacterized membrane protein
MLTAIVAFAAVYLLLRSWRLIAIVAVVAYALSG